MPSTSRSQQRLFCMALAVRKGDLERSKASKSVLDIADSNMTNKQIEDFTVLKNESLLSIKDYIRQLDEDTDWKYVDKYGTELDVMGSDAPIPGTQVIVRGYGKDLPYIVAKVDFDKNIVVLEPLTGLDSIKESDNNDNALPKYASEIVPLVRWVCPPVVFVVIKPGFMNKSAQIIEMFEDKGFKIMKTCAKKLLLSEAKRLYKKHSKEEYYNDLCKYMASGITYGILFKYTKGSEESALKECDRLKDRIRELWSISDMKNVIHSSDNLDDMETEAGIYF